VAESFSDSAMTMAPSQPSATARWIAAAKAPGAGAAVSGNTEEALHLAQNSAG
jgi:hypothetical protein